MDVSTSRHVNFMNLFKQFRDARPDEPDRGMLKKFALHLGMSERFLSHVKCDRKQIGHALAREIEDALTLPHGWMDQEHTDLDPKSMAERVYIETMLALFRSDPGRAQLMMLDQLKQRMGGSNTP